jgi:protein PhnA
MDSGSHLLPVNLPTFAAKTGKMKQDELLAKRSGSKCELCEVTGGLKVYEVPPATGNMDDAILVCPKCLAQVEKKEELDSTHWQCLTSSMWSEVPAVQVMAWRMLNRLRHESWAAEQLDILYLDEEKLVWAKASGDHENDGLVDLHKDCYGAMLQNGDNVYRSQAMTSVGDSLVGGNSSPGAAASPPPPGGDIIY